MAKRKMPPHIVLPDGRWRFVKKGRKSARGSARSPRRATHRVKRYSTMARRYHGRRRSGGRRFGRAGGILGKAAPAIGGAVENIVNDYIPMGIAGVGTIAVGYGLKNEFCKNYGMYQLGYSISGLIPIPGMKGGVTGVMF